MAIIRPKRPADDWINIVDPVKTYTDFNLNQDTDMEEDKMLDKFSEIFDIGKEAFGDISIDGLVRNVKTFKDAYYDWKELPAYENLKEAKVFKSIMAFLLKPMGYVTYITSKNTTEENLNEFNMMMKLFLVIMSYSDEYRSCTVNLHKQIMVTREERKYPNFIINITYNEEGSEARHRDPWNVYTVDIHVDYACHERDKSLKQDDGVYVIEDKKYGTIYKKYGIANIIDDIYNQCYVSISYVAKTFFKEDLYFKIRLSDTDEKKPDINDKWNIGVPTETKDPKEIIIPEDIRQTKKDQEEDSFIEKLVDLMFLSWVFGNMKQ